MRKQIQTINLNVDEWLELFQAATEECDTQSIHTMLHSLPQFQTHDQMKLFLILSMDVEALLCTMREQLVTKRTAITSQFLL